MTKGECSPETGNSLGSLLRPLWRVFGVERAWLFGGRARGKAGADSDWDLLVEFSRRLGFSNFMGLKCALQDTLGSKVDVLSRSAAKPGFLAQIERELVDVY
jgi:uncharacterized protein